MLQSLTKALMRRTFPNLLKCRNYFNSLIFKNLDAYYSICGLEGVNDLLLHAGFRHNADILRRFGASIGEGTILMSPLTIGPVGEDYSNLTIGRDCWLGQDLALDLSRPIAIGDNVTASRDVRIFTEFDVMKSPLKKEVFPAEFEEVVIKDGCFIGAGVIILHGVTVGECSLLAAGAVVMSDVPPYSVAAGVPAKVVKRLEPAE